MWNLGNRATVVLISVTCGCLLIYNAWGVILALVLSLFLVVYACYSLLANDSLVSPQARYVLAYLQGAIAELHGALDSAVKHNIGQVRKLWHSANRCYRERFPFRMDRRHGRSKSYQLSSDSYPNAAGRPRGDSLMPSSSTPMSTGFSLIDQLSPIPRDTYSSRDNDTPTTSYRYYQYGDHDRSQQLGFGRLTSTLVYRSGDRDNSKNGDIGVVTSTKRISPINSQSHTLSRGENITHFTPEGSPWNTSVSPKMRPRPAGMKTVQTVAGPLLASTRYNIDPKLYTDVSSPGLTTRLTKYATEAKNKLTHQSQYNTGQFPKVNINASPVPLLSTKLTKMRIPVTVKLAPPDVTRYSPPERQRLLSNIRHTPNKPTASVVQVLREISLKRHASREDVTFDVAKKQKTEDLFDEEADMVLEETKQKRSRDDSSKSEEDLSPQNIVIRPAKKRTKTQSCYDILNSLSSSSHVSSGVKRKAVDFSRSGTPDFEKHFKSLKSIQPSSSAVSSQSQNFDASHNKSEIKEIYPKSLEIVSRDKVQDSIMIKGILKPCGKELKSNLNKPTLTIQQKVKITESNNGAETTALTKSVKLTDKLFMRAEPERKEWLKLLAEEQCDVKAKFTTNNVEEIKKEDIQNMRQSSMKARLQSMFDAISGKAENKINPDVVIQADDVNAVTPITSSPSGCATLNSSTTTTNVNTTPISTAAIVPGGTLTSKPDTQPAFSLPNATLPAEPSTSAMNTSELKGVASILQTENSIVQVKPVTTSPEISSTESLQKIIPSTSNSTPTFAFGKSSTISEASPTITSSSLPSFGISNTSSSVNTILSIATPTTSAPTASILSTPVNMFGDNKTSSSSTFTPVSSSSTSDVKFETSNTITASTTAISFITTTNSQAAFTFGNNKLSTSSTMPAQTSAPTLLSQFTDSSSLPANTSTTVSVAGFDNLANSTASNAAITSSAAKPLFTFWDNNTTSQIPKPLGMFALGQSNANTQPTSTFGNVSSSQATSLPLENNKSFSFTPSTSTLTATSNSFGTNTSTTATPAFGLSTTTSTFSLTSTTSTPSVSKSLFVFGVNSGENTTTTPTTIAGATTVFGTMNTNAVPAFGTSTTTTVPQFGTSTTTVSQFGTPTTTVLQFGAQTTAAAPQFGTLTTTTASRFGAPTTTTPQFGTPTTSVPQFGTSTTTTPQFGVPTSTASHFGTPSNAVPQFGVPNTTAPQFGTSTTTSMFATTSNTTTTNIFGATSNQPIFGTGTSTSGAADMFNASKTASIFAVTTNVPTSDNAGNNNLLFTGANATSNSSSSTTAASSIFGSGTSPIFGQAKPSTSFGSASTNIFGNTSTSLFSTPQTTSALTLGSNKNNNNGGNDSTGGTTITPVFDTANNATPAFGANTGTAAANTQNANTPAFGGTTNIFGSTTDNTSVPLFGTNSNQPTAGTFGASTGNASTFGSGQNPASLTFGAATSGSGGAFGGDNKSLFGATATNTGGFGGSSISAFGAENASNTGTNASGMFFSNNQKDGQQGTAFAFTSSFNAGSNNSATASSVPFQFGAATTKPASTGFNFTAPSATPTINFGATGTPAFNPSTPGMFSIGSGSTVPRSRTNRTRKPR